MVSADRRAALAGADFVINMVQVGGIAATRVDFEVPASLRAASDHRGHARCGRRLPGTAHLPGAAGHRRGHAGGLPRRLAAQLHQPDGDERVVVVAGGAVGQGGRPVPQRLLDGRRTLRPGGRAPRGDELPRRRRQPPGVAAALGARRQGPLPAAGRPDRGGRGAAPAGPRGHVPPPGLLPDRDQRALLGVRAVVPARRAGGRAAAHPGGRLPRTSAPRTSRSTSRPAGRWRPASCCRWRRAPPSTRRRSSTPWSPGRRGPSTPTW